MKQLATLLVCVAAAMPSFAATAQTAQTLQASPTASWFSLPSSITAEPDSSVAWPFALGFLGLVVLRRTRSDPMF